MTAERHGAAGDAGRLSYLDQALWKRLDSDTRGEPDLEAWISLQCGMIPGAVSGVLVLGPADVGPYKPVAHWPTGRSVGSLASTAAEAAAVQRRGVVQGDGARGGGFGLAYPIMVDGRLLGVVAVQTTGSDEEQLRSAMRQLQWGAAWVELALRRRQAGEDADREERVATALDLVANAIEEGRFSTAALAVATELATRLGAERVSIGFLGRDRAEVAAISHTANFNKRMNLVRQLAAAMDEAMDQRASVVFPGPGAESLVTREHAVLADEHGVASIVTVPLFVRAAYFGAMTLEFPSGRPVDPALVDLCETVGAVVGPILYEKRQNDRPLLRKIVDAGEEQLRRLIGPSYFGRKLAALVTVLVVLFFTFYTKDYRVASDAVLEGAVQRVVAAPLDGYILSADVRAGDTVAEGQVMARLDDQELVLERQRWVAQRRQKSLEYDEAQAMGRRAESQIIRAEMVQAEAQIELLDEQLARTSLAAPFDGLVISGDLSQSIGRAVRQGETLFEIAPLDTYRVVLKVDEKDIDEIMPGQLGHMVIASMPENHFPLTVETVTPVSTPEGGRNYLRVEARLDQPGERLRPGMAGVAKVNVGQRRLIWIWTHGLTDWLRLKLWAWWE